MEKTFVNFTNHPSAQWSDRQRREALKYGNIQDIPFPDVDPLGDHDYIDGLADSCIRHILKFRPGAVLCQGEFCLAYQVIKRLQARGVLVLAACSERIADEIGGKKISSFVFRQFRDY